MSNARRGLIGYVRFTVGQLIFLAAAILGLLTRPRRDRLIWGPKPIIVNKYWSEAMRRAGMRSETLMETYYGSINRAEDYDLLFDRLVPRGVPTRPLRYVLGIILAHLHIIRHARVVHLPFSGGPLGDTALWWLEAYLFRIAGIRTVLIPYGADAYMYSQVIDTSLRHGLLISYPLAARREVEITRRVRYWSRHADAVIAGIMVDGAGRWDLATPNPFCIDTARWQPKERYSDADGLSGTVRIIHTPNHRGFKGTEFLMQAVNELVEDGLRIELVLLEKVPNEKVRELMQQADILAEQFIFTGYALSGIEGMASGLAVMSNLEHEAYTRVFRRYAFLNECPIVSTTPETLKRNLRALVRNPELRAELGRAGRAYVEKYHSYAASQHMFGAVYDKILHGKDVDLINLFHPLKSEYVRRDPVRHPLVESRLPARYTVEAAGAD